LTITLINCNLIILNSDGSNYEGVLTFIFNDTEYLSEIISLENEIPLVYNSPIIFDECCNITGEFNFDLYCYTEITPDFTDITLGIDPVGLIYINNKYQINITYEESQNIELLQNKWNNLFGNEITLIIENGIFKFYVLKSLNLCDSEISITVNQGQNTRAEALIEINILTDVYETVRVNNAILDLVYEGPFTDIDSFIEDFNNTNEFGVTIEYLNENIDLKIICPQGSAFNDTLWFITFNDDDEYEFISTSSQGGSNSQFIPQVTELDDFEFVVNNLQNEKDCGIPATCLNEEQLNSILNKIKKL
jgi:hypothetical protein